MKKIIVIFGLLNALDAAVSIFLIRAGESEANLIFAALPWSTQDGVLIWKSAVIVGVLGLALVIPKYLNWRRVFKICNFALGAVCIWNLGILFGRGGL